MNPENIFIAILSRDGDTLTVADPLSGMKTVTLRELETHSPFTGFHPSITRK